MANHKTIPLYYRIFFLYVEPLFSFIGALYALGKPGVYLQLTDSNSATAIVPVATRVAVRQLGNLYLLFGLNETLVLRATSDLRVWDALLVCLLIADIGHLASLYPLGLEIYWNVFKWNSIDWGNVAFVYCGAATRIAFLSGFGLSKGSSRPHKPATRSSQRRRKAG